MAVAKVNMIYIVRNKERLSAEENYGKRPSRARNVKYVEKVGLVGRWDDVKMACSCRTWG